MKTIIDKNSLDMFKTQSSIWRNIFKKISSISNYMYIFLFNNQCKLLTSKVILNVKYYF